jgi:Asp-tRNA(Asn)/Glu-tRNA(Gln) amidotransferase C subunit
MSSKLTQQELSDIMLQSVALSTILCEKFEIMSENNLVMHKAKQSLKTTLSLLTNYVNKVFNVEGQDEETTRHMLQGASHVVELSSRIETSLKAENLLSIGSRKDILSDIIWQAPLLEIQRQELYTKLRDSGIIDY